MLKMKINNNNNKQMKKNKNCKNKIKIKYLKHKINSVSQNFLKKFHKKFGDFKHYFLICKVIFFLDFNSKLLIYFKINLILTFF